jgi:predicted DNA-binding protein
MASSIRLSKKAEQRLDSLAKKSGYSKTFLLRELTSKTLRHLEEKYLAAKTGKIDGKTKENDPYEKLRRLKGKVHFKRTAAQLRGDGFNSGNPP